jgi:hypothetical protein
VKAFVAIERSGDVREKMRRFLTQFPLDFFGAAVAAVVSAHWLAYESKKLIVDRVSAAILLSASLVLLLVLARTIYLRRFKVRSRSAFLGLCGLFYLLDLASVAFHDVAPDIRWGPILFVVLLGSAYVVYRRREVLMRIRALRVYRWGVREEAQASAKESGAQAYFSASATDLLVLLSLPNIRPRIDGDFCEFRDARGTVVRWTKGTSVAEAIKQMDDLKPRANWQQLLRGVEPHVETVKRVYLCGSRPRGQVDVVSPGPLSQEQMDTHGSALYTGDCDQMLRLLLPEAVDIRTVENVDFEFENVEILERQVSRLVEEIAGRQVSAGQCASRGGSHDLEIVVETTGALKSTSIAGAIATLKGQTKFQYVGTNPPFSVLLHDLRIDEPPQPG